MLTQYNATDKKVFLGFQHSSYTACVSFFHQDDHFAIIDFH